MTTSEIHLAVATGLAVVALLVLIAGETLAAIPITACAALSYLIHQITRRSDE